MFENEKAGGTMDSNEAHDGQTINSCEIHGKWLEMQLLQFCFLLWPLDPLG